MPDNFSALKELEYSGRGVTMGTTPSGIHFVGYTLTGRSPPSQARELLLGKNTGVIRTSSIKEDSRLVKMFNIGDPEELESLKKKIESGSPSLIYYPAIAPVDKNSIAVSNGIQTELIYNLASIHSLPSGTSILHEAFKEPVLRYDPQGDRWIDITTYEPDHPNNTPRISGLFREDEATMHIVWSNGSKNDHKRILPFKPIPGEARTITTYFGGNEDPVLLPFQGELLDAAIDSEHAQDIAESLYDSIHGSEEPGKNYRVAAAVVMITPGGLETAIINRVDRGS